MARFPRYFDPVCRSLVAAGESGGKIDDMLRRLALLVRQSLKIRTGLAGSMVYPTLLIFVSIGVLGAMFGFVLPRFEGLFKTLEAPLPPTTKIMMGISTWMRQYWWIALGVLISTGVGLKYWLSTPSGRRWSHVTIVRLPQIGRIVRALATARIARVLGVLLEGKVPLLDALQLTREATGNMCYADLVAAAEDRVIRGENISSAFGSSRLIPQSVTEAIRSGEKTGQLAAVLTNIADYLDEDNEVVIRSITSIVEPLILLALGLVVGFVAISMFLPLFDLTSTAGKGGG
jgi:type II secretory pathway component PulF